MERFWPIWWSSFVISAVLVFGGGSVIAHGTSSDAVGVRMGAQLAAISGGMLLLVLVLTIDNEDAARDLGSRPWTSSEVPSVPLSPPWLVSSSSKHMSDPSARPARWNH